MSTDTFTKSIYEQIQLEEMPQAERLSKYILRNYNPQSICDVGCANGLYLYPYLHLGIRLDGYEINDEAIEYSVIPQKSIFKKDFSSKGLNLDTFYDLSICLEVLEHVEEQKAFTFIENLCRTSNTIIFSAAIPGQGGLGHINCQPKIYWEHKFLNNNFKRNFEQEDRIKTYMSSGYHMGWFTQNVMIFERVGRVGLEPTTARL